MYCLRLQYLQDLTDKSNMVDHAQLRHGKHRGSKEGGRAGELVPLSPMRHLSFVQAGSPLHRLCRNGDLSAIRSYLNETVASEVVNKVAGLNGCTPLHEAAMAGRADVIRLLVEECDTLDLNVRTHKGPASTPLHLTAERGHVECVVALVECGAFLNAVDRRCRTAKDAAAENGKRQVVHTLTLLGM